MFWINKINDFFRQQKIEIDPLPEVELVGDDEKVNDKSDILISTGGYQPETSTIVLYISNRHIKDILRSYCHEMIHHSQTLDNKDYIMRTYTRENVVDDPDLEEIEAEAYLKGNLVFRKFTEVLKKQMKKSKI